MLVTSIFSVYKTFLPFNTLPNYKFLDMSKLEAIADEILNVAEMTISLCCLVENSVGNGENAGDQHFLLFPWCFPKPSLLELLKVWIVCKRVNIPN